MFLEKYNEFLLRLLRTDKNWNPGIRFLLGLRTRSIKNRFQEPVPGTSSRNRFLESINLFSKSEILFQVPIPTIQEPKLT